MTGLLVVTGASRGIGRAICARGLDRGMAVCAVARSADELAALAALAPDRVEAELSFACAPLARLPTLGASHDSIFNALPH